MVVVEPAKVMFSHFGILLGANYEASIYPSRKRTFSVVSGLYFF